MKAEKTAEILELMGKLRHDGLTPLNVILQGATLLLDGKKGNLSDEQRKLLEMIQRSVTQATHSWYAASDELRIFLDQPADDWTAVNLNDIIEKTRTYFLENRQITLVWPQVPAHFPRLRANSDLPKAFIFLLDSLPVRYFLEENPPQFKAQASATQIQIHIRQPMPFYNKAQLAKFYGPGRKTAVYERIIAHHNGRIKINYTDEQVDFLIQLPAIPTR